MNKIKKFAEDHKDELANWSIAAGSIVGVSVVWYAIGKSAGARSMKITNIDFLNGDKEIDKTAILIVQHKNKKTSKFKYVD